MAAVAFHRAGADFRTADIDREVRRFLIMDHLPAIDGAGKTADQLEQRRRGLVENPAHDMDLVVLARDLDRKIGHPVGAQRRGMDIGDMAEIEQIVDQQPIAALDVKIIADRHPVGIVVPVEIRNRCVIGQRRIAHPDPDPAIALDHRIVPHARTRRHQGLSRHRDAGTGRIEHQPMIGAFDATIGDFAHRQRHIAMRTAILQRCGRPVGAAKQHDRLIHDGPRQRAIIKLMRPGGDIPAITEIFLGHPAFRSKPCRIMPPVV